MAVGWVSRVNMHQPLTTIAIGQHYTKAGIKEHGEFSINVPSVERHHALLFLDGQDPAVSALVWAACTLWSLGYPDRALERSQEALALVQEPDHPFLRMG